MVSHTFCIFERATESLAQNLEHACRILYNFSTNTFWLVLDLISWGPLTYPQHRSVSFVSVCTVLFPPWVMKRDQRVQERMIVQTGNDVTEHLSIEDTTTRQALRLHGNCCALKIDIIWKLKFKITGQVCTHRMTHTHTERTLTG